MARHRAPGQCARLQCSLGNQPGQLRNRSTAPSLKLLQAPRPATFNLAGIPLGNSGANLRVTFKGRQSELGDIYIWGNLSPTAPAAYAITVGRGLTLSIA